MRQSLLVSEERLSWQALWLAPTLASREEGCGRLHRERGESGLADLAEEALAMVKRRLRERLALLW